MNKDELVGYIQGLIDMSKEANEMLEPELLELIDKALVKHRALLNSEINYFNKKADEYATPKEKEGDDPIWNGPSEDLLDNDVDKGFIKHKQITKKQPEISNHGEFGEPNNEAPYGQD